MLCPCGGPERAQVAEQEKLKAANPARKPVLDEEQTKSLVSNFKETQGPALISSQ